MELKSALILVIFIILGVICFLRVWDVLEAGIVNRIEKSIRKFNENTDQEGKTKWD